MNGKDFNGRILKVSVAVEREQKESEPSSSLFVAKIPEAGSTDDLFLHFEKFGKGVLILINVFYLLAVL